ncbi:putative porin [Oceanicola granulosus HTCC2516]|uniref:Putative porin n=1 Tax=Oceanicola granulosus (strain ATCC BAA-861 / DSM 15982 / KCTC 12143 / HTCC2516) TaxID=314256 RepID=Q2CBC9_OCEGH|nr:porin [Oceanicola granulosus]EAR49969.1 putative porin [Oceanicola granulosus HTCC2516]
MKSILLASASIVAFTIAGAAQAEVMFGGTATLGFNDDDDDVEDDNDGFYWDANISVTLSQDLDNGITASATFDFDVADNNLGTDLMSANYLLALTSEFGGLYFGDTTFAAETYWVAAGDMAHDNFSNADGETVLRGEATFGTITGGLSYVVTDAGGDNVEPDEVDQLSLGARAEFGQFSVGMAYQEESDAAAGDDVADEMVYDPVDENGDFNTDQVFGIFGSTSFAGADVSVAYARNVTEESDSTGVSLAYPVGPVVLGASYAFNSDAENNFEVTASYVNGPVTVSAAYGDNDEGTDESYAVDARYDVGSGLAVLAGFSGGDGTADNDYYVAGEMDMGGGAMLTASYAVDDDDSEEDEIGAPEFQEGTTVELTFEF